MEFQAFVLGILEFTRCTFNNYFTELFGMSSITYDKRGWDLLRRRIHDDHIEVSVRVPTTVCYTSKIAYARPVGNRHAALPMPAYKGPPHLTEADGAMGSVPISIEWEEVR